MIAKCINCRFGCHIESTSISLESLWKCASNDILTSGNGFEYFEKYPPKVTFGASGTGYPSAGPAPSSASDPPPLTLTDAPTLLARKTTRGPDAPTNTHLLAFLWASIHPSSSLGKLRGNSDILRQIWVLVCEEYWALHIHFNVPKLYRFRGVNMGPPRKLQPHEVWPQEHIPDLCAVKAEIVRQWKEPPPQPDSGYSGVPMAVIGRGTGFPSPAGVCCSGEAGGVLQVNMMPFDLSQPEATLPWWCHGYLPMIARCVEMVVDFDSVHHKDPMAAQTAYLTVDEREVGPGLAQRRPGLHIESPVWPMFRDDARGRMTMASLFWGGGALRASRIKGGIFLCSSVACSTAIWNCQAWQSASQANHAYTAYVHISTVQEGGFFSQMTLNRIKVLTVLSGVLFFPQKRPKMTSFGSFSGLSEPSVVGDYKKSVSQN